MMKLVEERETELHSINQNQNIINIIFRNQKSEDILIPYDKQKLTSISILKTELLHKLKTDKDDNLRLFFKGRPLKEETDISSLSTNNSIIYIFYRTLR